MTELSCVLEGQLSHPSFEAHFGSLYLQLNSLLLMIIDESWKVDLHRFNIFNVTIDITVFGYHSSLIKETKTEY